jgi:hypothetical protein
MDKINPETIEQIKEFLNNNPSPSGYGLYHDFVSKEQMYDEYLKKTDAAHEIVFHITASLLEENEKGETLAPKLVYTKNFFIPVKPQEDIGKFTDSFFKTIEDCIIYGSQKS